MLRTSIPIGRYLGVEVRVQVSFLLLLALLIPFSTLTTGGPWRGLGLWMAFFFAVLVREIARAIAAVYAGLRLRALFLLPIGGIMAFAPADASQPAPSPAATRAIAFVGPAANLLVGGILLGLAYAVDPRVSLLAQPWVSVTHLLRSLVWLQVVLGLLSLVPTPASPPSGALLTGRKLPPQGTGSTPGEPPASRVVPFFGIATVIALGLIAAGFMLPNLYWLTLCGAFLLGAQISGTRTSSSPSGRSSALDLPGAQAILVRDVMVTDFTLLSSSDTLRSALDASVHSLQEVFPIVRGDRLVGSITRHTIAERLLAEGDSYLQGAMRRNLQIAAPAEPLVEALRRAASHGAGEFIPVLDDGAMVGLLTPQSLARAVQQAKLMRQQPAS